MEIIRLRTGSVIYGKLPPGCRLCQKGLKSVIFLTGLCPRNCFYCPLSVDRRNKDVFFINENKVKLSMPFSKLEKILFQEIMLSASLGASLTGGDPLVKPDRTYRIIRALKEKFGKNFHIHLYTSGIIFLKSRNIAEKLVESGLDELRLHSPINLLEKIIEIVKDYDTDKLSIGLEYPSIPNGQKYLQKLVKIAQKHELEFINLNELEFTETNAYALMSRGYIMAPDYRTAQGSMKTAINTINWAKENGYTVTIHYCPVEVKDTYQTGLRHYRKSSLSALEYNTVTDDGTLIEILYEEIDQEYINIALNYPPQKLPIFLEDIVKKGKYIEKTPTKPPIILEEEKITNDKQ